MLTFRGETLPLSVWAARLGVERHAVRHRIVNEGWGVERALTTPTPIGKPITFMGETHPLNVWAKKLDIPQGTLWHRIFRLGWEIERALSTPSVKQSRSHR
jgi:hypothetical protein